MCSEAGNVNCRQVFTIHKSVGLNAGQTIASQNRDKITATEKSFLSYTCRAVRNRDSSQVCTILESKVRYTCHIVWYHQVVDLFPVQEKPMGINQWIVA